MAGTLVGLEDAMWVRVVGISIILQSPRMLSVMVIHFRGSS